MLRHVQAVLDVLNAADATAWLCAVLVSAWRLVGRTDRKEGDHVMYTRPHCIGCMLDASCWLLVSVPGHDAAVAASLLYILGLGWCATCS